VTPAELVQAALRQWPGAVTCRVDDATATTELRCAPARAADVCGQLAGPWSYAFAGLVVEEEDAAFQLRYVLYGEAPGWVHVLVEAPLADASVPTITPVVHAADWHEREAEDHFGLAFEGHPRLGDFVLHDDAWEEGVQPMRRRFRRRITMADRRPNVDWRPRRIVEAPGAFVMPLGPVFAGPTEAVHLQLETVGEDVIRAFPRLFYKYRGIEKLAEGRTRDDALLLAERFAATTAFAHALAYSRAAETIGGVEAPPRAQVLRVFLAELERLRHHVGAIAGICESTGLAVAASQAGILEEDLLRVSGALAGHRYLFGLAVPGGLATDLSDEACGDALLRCQATLRELDRLWGRLRLSSGFVDRLEEVGFISERDAREHALVGPVARASGIARDLRAVQPYGAYRRLAFFPVREQEGDGYARMRVLFAEARQAVRLMEQALAALEPGPVRVAVPARSGAALGAVEAPRGAAFHWLRLDDDGKVRRYRIMPPSFANWHGFHLAVEDFAFQDLPIILATLDLSVAENDR